MQIVRFSPGNLSCGTLQAKMSRLKESGDKNRLTLWVQEGLTFLSLPESERLDYVLTHGAANLLKPYED